MAKLIRPTVSDRMYQNMKTIIIIESIVVMINMTAERKGMLMWRSRMVKTEVSKPSRRSGLTSVPILGSEVFIIALLPYGMSVNSM